MSQYLIAEKCEVSLGNHDVYSSKEGLLTSIEETKEQIIEARTAIHSFAATSDFRQLLHLETDDVPLCILQQKINELLDFIEESVARNTKATIIAENWENHLIG